MMPNRRNAAAATLLLAVVALALAPGLRADEASAPKASQPSGEGALVRVATLVYGNEQTSKCFASGFLDAVARQTQVRMSRSFHSVKLASESLFEHPFAIMTGEGAFTLSDAEKANLRGYLDRGGFLLASAGCSDERWARSFRSAIAAVYADNKLRPLAMDHPVFRTLYEIEAIRGQKQVVNEPLYGLEINGRLAVIFSPHGLNDTANAGDGCCCCGGNELRDAHMINANILVYALTH